MADAFAVKAGFQPEPEERRRGPHIPPTALFLQPFQRRAQFFRFRAVNVEPLPVGQFFPVIEAGPEEAEK